MNEYYFTFGSGQDHYPGHVKIVASSESVATEIMRKHHGSQYCRCYFRFDQLHNNDKIQRFEYKENEQ